MRNFNRHDKRTYLILGMIVIVLISTFAYTWFSPSNIPDNFHGWLQPLNGILFFITTYIVWHEIVAALANFELLRKIRPYKHKSPQKNLKVAFITTFVPGSEPHEMLRRNLKAITEVEYRHDTWLLDEGGDAGAKKICKELGVRYFTRFGKEKYNTVGGKFAKKTKGGNHNAWYDAHGKAYDIVAQVDTDFLVKKNFLTETLGQFRDPQVAFVGTPQYYGNYDEGLVSRGAAEQTYSFYGPVLRGQSGYNSTNMIGANHIVRVAALKEIDWYAAHLTEDLLTGMRLFAAGWKSVYCPKILAVGEGPSRWDAYFAQQMRWAHGCFDILFRHSWKLLPKMSFSRGIRLFILLQHYFTGLNMVVGSALLALYFLTGITTTNYSLQYVVLIYVPLLVWLYAVPLWYHKFNILHKKERGILLAGKIISLAVQPIYFLAFVGAVRNKKITFRVTPKGRVASDDVTFRLFSFHIAFGILSAVSIIIGIIHARYSYILMFWAIANIIVAIIFVIFVIRSKSKNSILKSDRLLSGA